MRITYLLGVEQKLDNILVLGEQKLDNILVGEEQKLEAYRLEANILMTLVVSLLF